MKTEMNNTGFTKGNWSVNPETRLNEYGVIYYSIDSDHGIDTLAETYGKDDGLANAKIIASAPQLLEALKEMLAAFEYDGQTEGENQACSKARQAINKATL